MNTHGRRDPTGSLAAWREILDRVKTCDHPALGEFAYLVERHGVPEIAREYVGKRIRDEINLGAGGPPKKNSVVRWNEYLFRQRLVEHVNRRQERYARVRLARPRSGRGVASGLLQGSPNPREPRGDWTPTKDGRWKIRSPLDYALRRVADSNDGVTVDTVRRWRKERKTDTEGMVRMVSDLRERGMLYPASQEAETT